jgi:tetratricopeptide (TPR) repeat protein
VAVFVVAITSSLTAQAPDPRSTRRDWQAWLDAVNTHVPGERDDAVARLAPWSRDELESAVFGTLRRQRPASQLGIVERGLVLHADIAVLNRTARGYALPPSGSNTPYNTTLFQDGRAVGVMYGTIHWEFGRRLLERLPKGDEGLHISRRFYRTAGAMLQLWGEYPELTRHLAAGRRALGDDPVLLLYEGTQAQAYAGPRLQRFFDERRRSGPTMLTAAPSSRGGAAPEMPSLPGALPTINGSRAQAERLFRRAIAIDPTLTEARIRLAHVLGDSERHDEAAAELQRAMVSPLPPMLDYYSSLLAGREARARGQLDAARTAFERAAALYPGASAPRYGLSEVAMARGDRTQSLSHLLDGARAAGAEANEPWWWVDRAHDPAAATLMAEMQRAVSR